MSNSSLVKYVKLSPNTYGKRTHAIDTISIHCMDGQLSVESCGNIFAKDSSDASSNYGIGTDGRIAMYVEENKASQCTSNKANDERAITIECASNSKDPYAVNDKVYNSLIELLVDCCKRNNISRLVWSNNKSDRVNHKNGCNMTVHRDYKNKACPGDYLYSRMGQIAAEVNKKLTSATKTGWNKDSNGWWYVYSNGTYPTNCWKTIDGKDYYFKADGYMASDEYVKSDNYGTNGLLYYVTKNGDWNKKSYRWRSNNKGWWIEGITTDWYPKSEWCKIDNKWYYFDGNGYMVTGKVRIGLKTYNFRSDGSLIE